jgi:hypothetical protein
MSFVRRSEDVTEGSTVGQVLDDETDLVNRMVKNAILEQTIDIKFHFGFTNHRIKSVHI